MSTTPDQINLWRTASSEYQRLEFINGYQSRNERLADLMRRFAICEEKGSGVDKVIQAMEMNLALIKRCCCFTASSPTHPNGGTP